MTPPRCLAALLAVCAACEGAPTAPRPDAAAAESGAPTAPRPDAAVESACAAGPGAFTLCTRTGVVIGNDPWPWDEVRPAMNAAAVGDCDDDGLPDAVMVDYGGPLRVWRNEGGFRFRDVTEASGVVVARGDATNAVLGDLDHDGRLDAVVTTGLRASTAAFAGGGAPPVGAVRIFRGLGGCRFEDVTAPWGFEPVALRSPSLLIGADLADLDGDGLLDVLPRVLLDPSRRPAVYLSSPGPRWRQAEGVLPATVAGSHWSTFVTSARGPSRPILLELFDGAQGPPPRFLSGRGEWPPVFVEETAAAPEPFTRSPIPYDPMGAASGDYDGDGLLDVFVTDVGPQHLLRQLPGGGFVNVSTEARTRAASPQDGGRTVAFTARFTDYDRDTWPDLAFASSIDGGNRPPPYAFLLRNRGDGTFEDVTPLLLQDGPYATEGLSAADLDRDGREDLWFGGGSRPPRILRNTLSGGNSLAVRLVGTVSNTQGLGARVRLRVGARTLVQELTASGATFGASEARLVFGLGAAAQAEGATVEWPSGLIQRTGALAAGREHGVEEPAFVTLTPTRLALGQAARLTLHPGLFAGPGPAPVFAVTVLPGGAPVPLRCAPDGACVGEVSAAREGLHAIALRAGDQALPTHLQFVVTAP